MSNIIDSFTFPDDEELDYLGSVLAESDDEDTTTMSADADKLDEDYAGYMELPGAEKDGGCKIVNVDGGVSKDKGCCNLFHPTKDADKFSCGTCKYEK